MKSPFLHLLTIILACSLWSFHSLNSLTWQEMKQFFEEFKKHPTTVGALAPCSPFVGREITKYLANYIENQQPSEPVHVLEVGAGTGSLTKFIESIIIKNPNIKIIVDVVEISPDFCKILHQKFGKNSNISIHCKSILDWNPEYEYQFIICTLPFNSFESSFMKTVIKQLQTLLKSNGILSYVAYAGIAEIKKYFLWGEAKREHSEKIAKLKSMRKKHQIDARTVIINCPPIRIYHLQIV